MLTSKLELLTDWNRWASQVNARRLSATAFELLALCLFSLPVAHLVLGLSRLRLTNQTSMELLGNGRIYIANVRIWWPSVATPASMIHIWELEHVACVLPWYAKLGRPCSQKSLSTRVSLSTRDPPCREPGSGGGVCGTSIEFVLRQAIDLTHFAGKWWIGGRACRSAGH